MRAFSVWKSSISHNRSIRKDNGTSQLRHFKSLLMQTSEDLSLKTDEVERQEKLIASLRNDVSVLQTQLKYAEAQDNDVNQQMSDYKQRLFMMTEKKKKSDSKVEMLEKRQAELIYRIDELTNGKVGLIEFNNETVSTIQQCRNELNYLWTSMEKISSVMNERRMNMDCLYNDWHTLMPQCNGLSTLASNSLFNVARYIYISNCITNNVIHCATGLQNIVLSNCKALENGFLDREKSFMKERDYLSKLLASKDDLSSQVLSDVDKLREIMDANMVASNRRVDALDDLCSLVSQLLISSGKSLNNANRVQEALAPIVASTSKYCVLYQHNALKNQIILFIINDIRSSHAIDVEKAQYLDLSARYELCSDKLDAYHRLICNIQNISNDQQQKVSNLESQVMDFKTKFLDLECKYNSSVIDISNLAGFVEAEYAERSRLTSDIYSEAFVMNNRSLRLSNQFDKVIHSYQINILPTFMKLYRDINNSNILFRGICSLLSNLTWRFDNLICGWDSMKSLLKSHALVVMEDYDKLYVCYGNQIVIVNQMENNNRQLQNEVLETRELLSKSNENNNEYLKELLQLRRSLDYYSLKLTSLNESLVLKDKTITLLQNNLAEEKSLVNDFKQREIAKQADIEVSRHKFQNDNDLLCETIERLQKELEEIRKTRDFSSQDQMAVDALNEEIANLKFQRDSAIDHLDILQNEVRNGLSIDRLSISSVLNLRRNLEAFLLAVKTSSTVDYAKLLYIFDDCNIYLPALDYISNHYTDNVVESLLHKNRVISPVRLVDGGQRSSKMEEEKQKNLLEEQLADVLLRLRESEIEVVRLQGVVADVVSSNKNSQSSVRKSSDLTEVSSRKFKSVECQTCGVHLEDVSLTVSVVGDPLRPANHKPRNTNEDSMLMVSLTNNIPLLNIPSLDTSFSPTSPRKSPRKSVGPRQLSPNGSPRLTVAWNAGDGRKSLSAQTAIRSPRVKRKPPLYQTHAALAVSGALSDKSNNEHSEILRSVVKENEAIEKDVFLLESENDYFREIVTTLQTENDKMKSVVFDLENDLEKRTAQNSITVDRLSSALSDVSNRLEETKQKCSFELSETCNRYDDTIMTVREESDWWQAYSADLEVMCHDDKSVILDHFKHEKEAWQRRHFEVEVFCQTDKFVLLSELEHQNTLLSLSLSDMFALGNELSDIRNIQRLGEIDNTSLMTEFLILSKLLSLVKDDKRVLIDELRELCAVLLVVRNEKIMLDDELRKFFIIKTLLENDKMVFIDELRRQREQFEGLNASLALQNSVLCQHLDDNKMEYDKTVSHIRFVYDSLSIDFKNQTANFDEALCVCEMDKKLFLTEIDDLSLMFHRNIVNDQKYSETLVQKERLIQEQSENISLLNNRIDMLSDKLSLFKEDRSLLLRETDLCKQTTNCKNEEFDSFQTDKLYSGRESLEAAVKDMSAKYDCTINDLNSQLIDSNSDLQHLKHISLFFERDKNVLISEIRSLGFALEVKNDEVTKWKTKFEAESAANMLLSEEKGSGVIELAYANTVISRLNEEVQTLRLSKDHLAGALNAKNDHLCTIKIIHEKDILNFKEAESNYQNKIEQLIIQLSENSPAAVDDIAGIHHKLLALKSAMDALYSNKMEYDKDNQYISKFENDLISISHELEALRLQFGREVTRNESLDILLTKLTDENSQLRLHNVSMEKAIQEFTAVNDYYKNKLAAYDSDNVCISTVNEELESSVNDLKYLLATSQENLEIQTAELNAWREQYTHVLHDFERKNAECSLLINQSACYEKDKQKLEEEISDLKALVSSKAAALESAEISVLDGMQEIKRLSEECDRRLCSQDNLSEEYKRKEAIFLAKEECSSKLIDQLRSEILAVKTALRLVKSDNSNYCCKCDSGIYDSWGQRIQSPTSHESSPVISPQETPIGTPTSRIRKPSMFAIHPSFDSSSPVHSVGKHLKRLKSIRVKRAIETIDQEDIIESLRRANKVLEDELLAATDKIDFITKEYNDFRFTLS